MHIVYGLIEDYRAALAKLRPTVRAALEGIIGEVRQQAYYQNDVLAQDGLLEKTLIYTGAFLDGLYSGASHTAEMAWRLVSDSASRVEDIARTAWQSLRAGDIEHLRGQLLLLARHLGLAAEQAARMAQDAALILSDSQLRGMLEAFPEDYFAAHNSVAKVHMLASLGMQLLTLIFIGVATDGAGAAAQALGEGAVAFTASGEFATLAQALREAVAVLEKIPLARALDALAGQRIDTVVEDEAGAVVGTAARGVDAAGDAAGDAAERPPGLHNHDWPEEGIHVEKFKTRRVIDMEHLSAEDGAAVKALEKQGWSAKKVKQILESGDHFRTQPLQAGDKLYGFTTAGRERDLANSAYWLDQAGYDAVKAKFYRDGVWDREGVKNFLALPCYNRANGLDIVKATRPASAVRATIGKATELIQYDDGSGYSTGLMGKIMAGGGDQLTPEPSALKLLTQQR